MNLKIIKYSLFLFGITVGYAQDIYVETSLSTASFEDVNTLENRYSKPVELGIGLGVILDVSKNQRLKWDFGVNYNKYEINTSFSSGNNSNLTEYNLSYVSFKTGPYFSVVNHKRFKLQLHVHNSFDYLIFGSNQYRGMYVDLTAGKSFRKLQSNYHYGATFELVLSNSKSLYLSYDSKNSISDAVGLDQSYQLNATSILIGFRFKLNRL
jgi:hypothetical protein